MNEFKYSNGFLHYPEWMIETESQKDGKSQSYFFTKKETEKKYGEWHKWGGVKNPVFVKRDPPIPCTEALQKILQESKVYTEGLFFIIGVENKKSVADIHHYPVILDKNGFKFHSTLKDVKIPMPWHYLWHEAQVWYGDVQKKETEEEFVRRLQKTFSLTQNKES